MIELLEMSYYNISPISVINALVKWSNSQTIAFIMTNGVVDCYSLTDQNSEIQDACAFLLFFYHV